MEQSFAKLVNQREWLARRQRAYDRLVAEEGNAPSDLASPGAVALHERIIDRLDALPEDQGGRGWVERRRPGVPPGYDAGDPVHAPGDPPTGLRVAVVLVLVLLFVGVYRATVWLLTGH